MGAAFEMISEAGRKISSALDRANKPMKWLATFMIAIILGIELYAVFKQPEQNVTKKYYETYETYETPADVKFASDCRIFSLGIGKGGEDASVSICGDVVGFGHYYLNDNNERRASSAFQMNKMIWWKFSRYVPYINNTLNANILTYRVYPHVNSTSNY
jgi:hypothetical protein